MENRGSGILSKPKGTERLVVMYIARVVILCFGAGPVRDLFRVLEVVSNRLRTLHEVAFHHSGTVLFSVA